MEVGYNIEGLTQLLEAERTVGAKTEGVLTEHLLAIGADIAEDARTRYRPYSSAGGAGVQAKVFTSGLWVLQTLKKSNDERRRRPNFGPLMMRHAFLPALRDNQSRAASAARAAVEQVAATYWR
jgi:hypothetical protein